MLLYWGPSNKMNKIISTYGEITANTSAKSVDMDLLAE